MVVSRTLLVLLGVTAFGAARGADQLVTNCAGDAELRADLATMQSQGGGTLTFACASSPATIVVSGTLPNLTTATTIDGAGVVTISGGNAHRIFVVNAGATLTLRRLAVTNALAQLDGGAIISQGALVIEDARFEGNRVTDQSGGAILALGPLTIRRSMFIDNAAVNGGALYPRFAGAVTTIEDSLFEDNHTTSTASGSGIGGAILAWDGAPVTIRRSTFVANRGTDGAAIYIVPNSQLTLVDSTLRDNTGTARGAIYNGGTALVEKSTVMNNGAFGTGGLYNAGTLTVVNSTFSGNQAFQNNAAAIMSAGTSTVASSTFVGNAGATLARISGSFVVRNSAVDGPGCNPAPTSEGFNVTTDASCGFTATGDRQNAVTGLGPLAANGGPTLTHAPAGSSVLVDSGTATGCPATDQRGVARPVGASCDVGAVELGDAMFANGFE